MTIPAKPRTPCRKSKWFWWSWLKQTFRFTLPFSFFPSKESSVSVLPLFSLSINVTFSANSLLTIPYVVMTTSYCARLENFNTFLKIFFQIFSFLLFFYITKNFIFKCSELSQKDKSSGSFLIQRRSMYFIKNTIICKPAAENKRYYGENYALQKKKKNSSWQRSVKRKILTPTSQKKVKWKKYHCGLISRLFFGPWNKIRDRRPLFTCFSISASHW